VRVSTANRPPRFVALPPRIVVPTIVVGLQSLKPGLTVNCSVGAVRSGPTGEEPDSANVNAVQSEAVPIAPPPRQARFAKVIDRPLIEGRDD
jgi:hypothetical protein